MKTEHILLLAGAAAFFLMSKSSAASSDGGSAGYGGAGYSVPSPPPENKLQTAAPTLPLSGPTAGNFTQAVQNMAAGTPLNIQTPTGSTPGLVVTPKTSAGTTAMNVVAVSATTSGLYKNDGAVSRYVGPSFGTGNFVPFIPAGK